MKNKIQKLEDHLNFIWSLIPNKPTYGEFNKVFPVDPNINVLRNFELENEWFSIARYDTKDEGLSILSLFASITDFLTDGYRLSFETESEEGTPVADQTIVGFKMINYNVDL